MDRPFSSFGIEQLEKEFETVRRAGDPARLKMLSREVARRTVPRARALAKKIDAELEPSENVKSASKPIQKKSGPAKKSSPTSRSPKRTPTPEQSRAIELFEQGGSLKINAFAGAGKTSTLEMLAHASRGKGQYLAFNRDIVREAKERFPSSVNCSTTHGLAFRALAGEYRGDIKKLTDRVNANQLSDMLGLKEWRIDAKHKLSPKSFGFLVLDTVRRFAMSAENEMLDSHVGQHGSLRAAPQETLSDVNEAVLGAARHTWSRMIDAGDPMPMGHDGYLKLWALGEPMIAADFILMDEAQDTNPVVLEVLRNQRAQMVYVGDKHQQIYAWRGAVNAMNVETDQSAYLTTSFRFGEEIASAASVILRRMSETLSVQGNPALASRIGAVERPDAILARTNASTITALIEAIDSGKRPHLVGGPDELKAMLRGVIDLKAGKPSEVPDFFGFANWREVVDFSRDGEGGHLQTFANLVENQGEKKLLWALNRTSEAEKANLVISTAHKAKGREWKTVRLMDDFLKSQPKDRAPSPGKPADDQGELRLLYVAITRAKDAIEVPPPVLQLLGRAAPPRGGAHPLNAPSVNGNRERQAPPKTAWQQPRDWKPEATAAKSKSEATTSAAPEPPKEPKGFLRRFFS